MVIRCSRLQTHPDVRSREHSAAIAARDSPAASANCDCAGGKRDGLAGRSGWQLAFAGRLAGNGEALSFRRKLLLVFALTVFLCVGAVTWIVSSVTRRAFERANEDQTTALIAQFRREFSRRGDEVAHRVETIAGSDAATRMALAVSRGSADYSAYVNEAKTLADNQQLDFLEFVDSQRHDSLVGAVAGEIWLQGKFPAAVSPEAPSTRRLSPAGGTARRSGLQPFRDAAGGGRRQSHLS